MISDLGVELAIWLYDVTSNIEVSLAQPCVVIVLYCSC